MMTVNVHRLGSRLGFVIALASVGCGTTRRDVARVDPQPGTTPAAVQPGIVQAPIAVASQPMPAAHPVPQAQFVGATPMVPAMPTPAVGQPMQPPVMQPPNVSFSSPTTGSTFTPSGGYVAGPPMTGSPIPTTSQPTAAPIATTGTMVQDPGAGFLSNTNLSGLSFQPSQPAMPVYGPGQTVVPARPPAAPQTSPPSPPAQAPRETPEPLKIPDPPNEDLGKRSDSIDVNPVVPAGAVQALPAAAKPITASPPRDDPSPIAVPRPVTLPAKDDSDEPSVPQLPGLDD